MHYGQEKWVFLILNTHKPFLVLKINKSLDPWKNMEDEDGKELHPRSKGLIKLIKYHYNDII